MHRQKKEKIKSYDVKRKQQTNETRWQERIHQDHQVKYIHKWFFFFGL